MNIKLLLSCLSFVAAAPELPSTCLAAVHADGSHCRAPWSRRPPALPADWNVLPHHLRSLGTKLFHGNETFLDELVRSTAEPACNRFFCSRRDNATLSLLLVQPAGDSGVRRLAREAKWGCERGGNEGDGYSIRFAAAREGDVIVDIGANLGDVTVAAATLHPNALVIGIEANPVTYFYMRWNLHLNGLAARSSLAASSLARRGGVVALHGAAGHLPMRMYTAPGNSMNAMTVPQPPSEVDDSRVHAFLKQWPGAASYDLAAVDLPRVLSEAGISQVRLLKVDCEGCEYELLPLWAADGFLNRVRLLAAETHARYSPDGTYPPEAVAKLDATLFARGCTRRPLPRAEFKFPC